MIQILGIIHLTKSRFGISVPNFGIHPPFVNTIVGKLHFQKKVNADPHRWISSKKGDAQSSPLLQAPHAFLFPTPGQRETAVRSRGGGRHGAPRAHKSAGDNPVAPCDRRN
jgi:hypothetical protein